MKRFHIYVLSAIFFATARSVAVANEILFLVNFRYPPSTPTDVKSTIEVFEADTQKALGSETETQRNRQVVCRVAPLPSTTTFLLKFKTTMPNRWVIDYIEPIHWTNPGGFVGEKRVVNKVDELGKALSEIETGSLSDLQAADALAARAKRFLPDSSDGVDLRYYSEAHLRYARAERRLLETRNVSPLDRYNAFASATNPIKPQCLPPALSRSFIAERYDLLTSAIVEEPQEADNPKKLAKALNRADFYVGDEKKQPDEEWRDVLRAAKDIKRSASKATQDTDRQIGRAAKNVERALQGNKKVSPEAAKEAARFMKLISPF